MTRLASLFSMAKRSAPTPTARATASISGRSGCFSSTTARARRTASSSTSSIASVTPLRPLIAWPSSVTTS
jgi:hypothetical protein